MRRIEGFEPYDPQWQTIDGDVEACGGSLSTKTNRGETP